MNIERGELLDSRHEYGSYSRRISEFNPLESIQNKPSTSSTSAVSDIDKKIQ
jgi:hypothetical protein